jgi:hypothetical protein
LQHEESSMIAELNQNDIDNLKLAIDKMKSVDFDAARKMELLLEAYEKQGGGESDIECIEEAIETLPGWKRGTAHSQHVEDTAAMLDRAIDSIQAWRDSNDDEPLDDAVARLVQIAEGPNVETERLAEVLDKIVAVVDRGESDALIAVRNLAAEAL